MRSKPLSGAQWRLLVQGLVGVRGGPEAVDADGLSSPSVLRTHDTNRFWDREQLKSKSVCIRKDFEARKAGKRITAL